MTIGVPHASNLTNSLPERVDDPAFPRQLKRIIRNLYDQLDYARGTSSGRSEYLTSGTNGTLQVPYGGTGTTSGVSGGIPYYSATTLMASTALLSQNNLMLGGGAGTAPSTMAHPSTANQYALTGTTGTSSPAWTIATSSAATGTLALRDASGGLAMTSLTATTLTATFATFSGTVIAERLIVNGAATMSAVGMATLTATHATLTGTLRVGGGLTVASSSTLSDVGMATLTATSATFSGTIHAQGATFSAVRSTTLTVTGASTLAAVSCATLTATAATFSGTIHGQAATFTAVNVSSLTVSGAATMGAVSMATLTGTSATLTGTLRVGGGLTIAGASTLAAVSMATLTGTMGQLTRLGIGAAPHATAPLYVNDMASGYGVLVGNATTFQQFGSDSSAWVAWARNAFLSGGQWTRLQSYAGAQLIQMTDGGDIRFMRQTDGATTSGTIISWGYAGQVDSAGRWGLGGAASATYTAYVYGNTWINGSLDSTDITSSNSLVVAGAVSLSSTLVVGGGVTISGALNAASATLTGTARIGGGLTVAGASTLSAVGMATLTATAATFSGAINGQGATLTRLNLTGLAANGVLFAGADGLVTHDPTMFAWDDTQKGLAIGTIGVSASLTVIGPKPATVAGEGDPGLGGLSLTSADGGDTSGTTGQTAGAGGSITLQAGWGGAASVGSTNGTGGSLYLYPGPGGNGTGAAGPEGDVMIADAYGRVGLGAATQSGFKVASGNLYVGGVLTVTGAATMAAVGMATLTATAATFTGAMQLGSTLTVVGVGNFAAATFTGVVNLGAGLIVAGATTMAAVSCATLSAGAISGTQGNFSSTIQVAANSSISKFYGRNDNNSATIGTESGELAILSADSLYGTYIGVSGSTGNTWFQAMRNDGATAYNLQFQTNGGRFLIGTASDDGANKLQVSGGSSVGKITIANATTSAAAAASTHKVQVTISGVTMYLLATDS